MSTHIVCGCNNEDCRLNGCLIMRQRNKAGGFYVADSADFGFSTRSGGSKTTKALTDEQKAKFVNNIIEYGTEFVSPLLSVVESIEQAILQSEQVQAWKRDAERYRATRAGLVGTDPEYGSRFCKYCDAMGIKQAESITEEQFSIQVGAGAYADARVAESQQWNPIETAPHETLVVLGWYDENGVFKQEIALASAGRRYPGGSSDMWWHGRATHWTPLPSPPLPEPM